MPPVSGVCLGASGNRSSWRCRVHSAFWKCVRGGREHGEDAYKGGKSDSESGETHVGDDDEVHSCRQDR